ncbi:MAG: transaldolase [Chloroflexota bacterium]|nr:transaldolase [Chloroflexota bacterium]
MNSVMKLLEKGQSVWYDNIERRLLENGEMAGMIERGEIRGVTSNPSIFMKAITKSTDYDKSLMPLKDPALSAEDVFFILAIEDIQAAADLFHNVYQESNGDDGLISLEVSPYIADDTEKTLMQAKDLWQRVNRPNLLVKIPGTKAGLPAFEEAIFAGVNVNITLIFSLERYREVMEAYLKGLERRVEAGLPLDTIAAVASFFISRIDVKVDKHLQAIIDSGGEQAEKAKDLMGKAAIANARLAYEAYKNVFNSDRFTMLREKGARPQRPLWASTSTKNPNYRDVLYVEELIGPETINTIPPHTLEAILDHGVIKETLEKDLEGARQCFAGLENLGISMDEVTSELLDEGLKSFADAFTLLLDAIDDRRKSG